MRIAVLAPDSAWHFQDLCRAAGTQHELLACDIRQLSSSVGSHGKRTFYCGDVCLSDVGAVIVRIMPAGSLEQIVLRMDILNSLARSGVRVVNDPKVIEMSVDKYLTLARLAEHSIPVPDTFACETVAQALDAFDRLGDDAVVKPIFGSMGQGIERLRDVDSAAAAFERIQTAGQVIFLQRFVDHGDFDLRLLLIGDRVLAMRRTRPGHWLTNIACGATGSFHEPSACEIQLARKAAAAVGAEIAGVDLIYDSNTNKPLVLEVNAAPGWEATSAVLQTDIAALVLQQVCRSDEPHSD